MFVLVLLSAPLSRAQVFYGVLEGDEGDQFLSVWALDDVTGDGVMDLLIAGRRTGRGVIELVCGSTLEPLAPPIVGEQGSGGNRHTAPVGDFDGDGTQDFARGFPFGTNFEPQPHVRVYSTASWSEIDRVFPTSMFLPGTDLAPVGDVDSNGFDDFLVTGLEGAVQLFGGPDGRLLRTYASTLRPSMVGLGDVDADLVPDYAVFAGAVIRVISGATDTDVYTISSSDYGSGFSILGVNLTNVGDVDGDQVDDLAFALEGWPGIEASGTVVIVSGADGETILVRVEPYDAGVNATEFGVGIASGGDVNGDGFPELMVESFLGRPSIWDQQIDVVSTRTGATIRRVLDGIGTDPISSVSFRFWDFGVLDDLDGDGYDEWFLGNWDFDGMEDNSGAIWIVRGGPGESELECTGAANGLGAPATLRWSGPPHGGVGGTSIEVAGGPPYSIGQVFFAPPGPPLPAADGWVCLVPPLARYAGPFQLDVSGQGTVDVDWDVGATYPAPDSWAPGTTFAFQAAYRDPLSSGTGVNFTDAWRVLFAR